MLKKPFGCVVVTRRSAGVRHMGALALTGVLWALLVPALGHAADTGPAVVVAEPSVQERLAVARKAIAGKDWRGALAALRAAHRADPAQADVNNLLGYTYRKQASPDLPKAFEHYKLALKADPRHKGAHEYIGEAYLMNHQPDEARKHLAQLEMICGNRSCEEYVDLERSIQAYVPR
jgi:tetratricopeptide (TPR) repeat protein